MASDDWVDLLPHPEAPALLWEMGPYFVCPNCDGNAVVAMEVYAGSAKFYMTQPCPVCAHSPRPGALPQICSN
jgi:hypothetical protein